MQIKQRIIKTHLFNLVTSRTHQIKRRKELKRLAESIINECNSDKQEVKDNKVSNYVWVCWWQGEEDMSPLVRGCYERICKFNEDKKVILITEKNISEYVQFPEYINEKYKKGYITKTHFSDLLRTELLYKYGGVWMDITIFTHSAIPEEFYKYPVYSGRCRYDSKDYNVSKSRWTSFFWVSRYSQNVLFQFLSEFWEIYWEKYDDLIEYFLIDYVIDLGYTYVPQIKKEIDLIPLNGCGRDVWKLLKCLPDTYNDKEICDIEKDNWLQKLSYKGEEHIQNKSPDPKNSVYRKLFLNIE